MEDAVAVAVAFTILSLLISCASIVGHLQHFSLPEHQRYVCRLLFMVPIYAVLSLASLLVPSAAAVFGMVRDCYEGFVVYSFFRLLTVYLGEEEVIGSWLEVQGRIEHAGMVKVLCPTLKMLPLGPKFLIHIRQGILQFVFVKPVMALLALILAPCGYYTEGSLDLHNGYLYISMANNFSVSIALYCLILFYLATETILTPFRPVSKFLVVKAVVFFSYWQYCALQLLAQAKVLESQRQVFILQNVMVCAEMFPAAIAHALAFPSSDYTLGPDGRSPMSSIVNAHSIRTGPLNENLFKKKVQSTGASKNDIEQCYDSESDSDEEHDDPSSRLLPRLFQVLDTRDVIEDGREAFLDGKQVSVEEFEKIKI